MTTINKERNSTRIPPAKERRMLRNVKEEEWLSMI